MNWKSGSIKPFWDDEYRNLSYTHELFNNNDDLTRWRQQGYNHVHEYFTGFMCDMRKKQPTWNEKFIEWFSEEFKGIVVPHFIDDDIFFLDQKRQICKVSLTRGQVYFREKFAGAVRKYSYLLAISGEDVYLISKLNTLLVDKADGLTSEIKEMNKFSKQDITAACGNNLDQISNISSHVAAAAQASGYVTPVNGGDGGGGGGDGG